ncbi:prolactin-releasing peptide receptor-like [Porites lutea]|uniref:prolactin-releasing peptide receptor-like n=1 Tax=Porites lutea TaxID=51062 RepID=UPI003CC5EB91
MRRDHEVETVELWNDQSKAFAIAVALLGLILIIGVIGNGVVAAVITALRRRGHKNSVQLFLLHLAISDLMVCLLCIPLTIFTNFYYPQEYLKDREGLCKLSRFMQHLGPVISVSLLTAISIDRYLTFVKQELSCSQRSWYLRPSWLILFAWVYGTAQTLPVFHSADVVPIDFKNSTIYYCTTTQGHSLSRRIYLAASVLLGFIIPLATMSVSYYRVIRVVWTRNRRLSTAGSPTSNATITNENLLLRSRKRVLRVLLIVVVCFVICWLPFAVYHGILEQHLKKSPNPMDTVRLIAYGLGLANSICNPFIYYFNVGGKSFCSMKRSFLEVMGGKISPPRGVETNAPISRSAHANPGTALQLGFHSTSNAQNYDHHKQTYTAYNNSNGRKFSENALGLQKDTLEDTKL